MSLRLPVFVFLCSCLFANLRCSELTTGDSDVSDLKAKFLKMEKRMTFQEYRIHDLEDKVRHQDQEIRDLKIELSSLQPKMRKMETGFENLMKAIKRTKLSGSDIDISHTEKDIKPVNTIKPKRLSIGREPRIVLQTPSSQDTAIAFYAYMGGNEDTPGKHHPLVFNFIKTNKGDGYNGFTGAFTAPLDGLYVFSTSIRMSHEYAAYEIVKNGQAEGSVFVDAEHSSENRYSSATIIIELKQADAVMVRTSATYTPHGRIISDVNGRTSFTGWRIQ